jgi:hypothetical protein
MTTARQTRKTAKKDRWRAPFLAALAATGNVSSAVVAADVSRAFVYAERQRDEAFAALWNAALDEAADALEFEARRRAVEGWEEPVFGSLGQGHGSGEIGTVRKYSDTLLIFLMKGANPEKYRERTDVKQSGEVKLNVVYGTDRQTSEPT